MEQVPWRFVPQRMDWRQGEHITIIGPTGRGKTTLALALLPMRDWVCIAGTKAKDPTLAKLTRGRRPDYRRIEEWPPKDKTHRRVALWPKLRKVEDRETQKDVFRHMLRSVFRAGGWCVYLDELRYITHRLRLIDEVELIWEQGRSLDISLVTGFQRPAHVPLLAYSQATHVIAFGEKDRRNIDRLREVAWPDTSVIDTVRTLDHHSFLYGNTRTGDAFVSRLDRL